VDTLSLLHQTLGGRYRIEREIGRGGMALVYLAEDLKHRRRVAVKVLNPISAAHIGSERFLREIEIAARLAHPNILPLHDSGDADGILYYVMPFVEGETLRGRLNREKQLPLDDAIQVAREVADALAYSHSMGLIHRDIKPENILFQSGHAVVTDFGIARAVTDRVTESGMAIGTLPYMSPEQAAARSDLDGRTDIYSLGCVLYEMLTGELPLGPTISPASQEGPAVDLRTIRPSISLPLADVIGKALARVPADRFSTALQFREALDAPVMPLRPAKKVRWRQFALAGGLLAVVAAYRILAPAVPGNIKLAVLPFENLTGDPAQDYFSDGLTEEMITQLGRLAPQRLGIIARTSAMRYKKTDKPVDQIGRELGAEYVLEGSARREGNRVRIAAQLIRARDQTQVWAETYDRDMSGILVVQGAVAQGVAGSLALTLLPGERARLASPRAVNPEAYEAYLRGHEHNSKLTRADLETSLEYYRIALAKDSSYALAYAGIAHAWSGLQQMGFVPPAEAQPHMREAIAQALALDSTLAGAHARLAGLTAWSDWNWKAGEVEFQKALALDPGAAETHASYSHFLQIMKRPTEAATHIRKAMELDPLNPQVRAFYAVVLNQDRRFDEGLAQLRQVLATVPNMPMALTQVPNALHLQGRLDEALKEERTAWSLRKDEEALRVLEQGYAEGKYPGAMHRLADLLAARTRSPAAARLNVAAYYLKAGDHDKALDWLERAFQARDPNVPYIRIAPLYDPLRGEARFEKVIEGLRFPPVD
jgi:serine/threonine-protein kinase